MMTSAVMATMLGASIATDVTNKVGNLIDVYNAPNQLKSVGSIDLARITNADKSFIENFKIEDFEKVAETYERTGYRVDKMSDDTMNFLAHIYLQAQRCRHYFNPVQLSDMVLMPKVNMPKSLLDDFERRCKNGLRWWNVEKDDVTMGDFQYDNVEEDYIQ